MSVKTKATKAINKSENENQMILEVLGSQPLNTKEQIELAQKNTQLTASEIADLFVDLEIKGKLSFQKRPQLTTDMPSKFSSLDGHSWFWCTLAVLLITAIFFALSTFAHSSIYANIHVCTKQKYLFYQR